MLTGALHFVPDGESIEFPLALRNPELLREAAFIGGHWRTARNGASIEVRNPANGELIGRVPKLGKSETREAIEAAARAYPAWRALLPQERCDHLLAWYALMRENREDLARIMTLEQGKPLADARGEIDYAAGFIQWFAEEAKRVSTESVISHLKDRHLMVVRAPVGVTAAITPWNFPSAMITRKAAAALAAGCPMVVRPASETPFSAIALAVLAERAGLPAGVFSVITGSAREIAAELCACPAVRAISFTGSTNVGRRLIAQGAGTVKRMSMELGGHAPFIAFSDADVEEAALGAVAAKFQSTGQDCLAANRIYVHRDIYDAFCQRFAALAGGLEVGPGWKPGVEQGPLMNERAVMKCEAHVSDAVARGARVLAGGGRHPLGGSFFEPTVLVDATPDMAIWREETFGPVAAVMPFEDEGDVIAAANDTEFGLAAYVYSRDVGRVWRAVDGLEYGMVVVNGVKMTGAPIPFGGVKQSGLGREGGRHGIEEFTDLKYICMNIL